MSDAHRAGPHRSHYRSGFRADIIVDCKVIIEIKSVSAIQPAHESQSLTYLRMSGIPIGLLLNFNASRLTDGLRRLVV
jgi:GxxExxY protein